MASSGAAAVAGGSILVVEDDRLYARVLTRYFTRYGRVRAAGSIGEARMILADMFDLIAIVVDVTLPDGSGLDLLAEVRAMGTRAAGIPALVLTGHVDPELINKAQLLHAEYACKPIESPNLEAFAQHIASATAPFSGRGTIEAMARTYDLSPREVQICAATLSGVAREDLATAMKLSRNTIKTHVRRLCRKIGVRDLGDLARKLLKEGAQPS